MKLPRGVTIRIRPDGKVEVETDGFVGMACTDLTKILALALGGPSPDPTDVFEEFKPEYYITEHQNTAEIQDRDP